MPTPLTHHRFHLGEGPVWDAAQNRLLWVDITAGEVLEGRLEGLTLELTGRTTFDAMVGAVALGDDGSLLVAGQKSLLVQTPEGSRRTGPQIVPDGAARRLNDGSTDPAGRFLVGTLSLDDPSTTETLVRLELDGSLTVLDDDLTLSNGLAWSVDGTRMFSVDTLRQVVNVRSYDVASGATGPRAPFVTLTDGFPDGIAMDAEDHLWVAVWGAGVVRRFTPTGQLSAEIAVPAPHTSCVAFAGDDLRTLVITTATQELGAAELAAHPDSGRLFGLRVDVPGRPVTPWASVSLQPTAETP